MIQEIILSIITASTGTIIQLVYNYIIKQTEVGKADQRKVDPAFILAVFSLAFFFVLPFIGMIIAIIGCYNLIRTSKRNGQTKWIFLSFSLSLAGFVLCISHLLYREGSNLMGNIFKKERAVFNTHFNDWPTLSIYNINNCRDIKHGNIVESGNNKCWKSIDSGLPGDTILVRLYYHNTSTDTARNVRLFLSGNDCGNMHFFSGNLNADNITGLIPIGFSQLINKKSFDFFGMDARFLDAYWFKDQDNIPSALLYKQKGNEIISDKGLFIGDIAPGSRKGSFEHQGLVIVKFRLELDTTQNYF
jgi:hypothetical protein